MGNRRRLHTTISFPLIVGLVAGAGVFAFAYLAALFVVDRTKERAIVEAGVDNALLYRRFLRLVRAKVEGWSAPLAALRGSDTLQVLVSDARPERPILPAILKTELADLYPAPQLGLLIGPHGEIREQVLHGQSVATTSRPVGASLVVSAMTGDQGEGFFDLAGEVFYVVGVSSGSVVAPADMRPVVAVGTSIDRHFVSSIEDLLGARIAFAVGDRWIGGASDSVLSAPLFRNSRNTLVGDSLVRGSWVFSSFPLPLGSGAPLAAIWISSQHPFVAAGELPWDGDAFGRLVLLLSAVTSLGVFCIVFRVFTRPLGRVLARSRSGAQRSRDSGASSIAELSLISEALGEQRAEIEVREQLEARLLESIHEGFQLIDRNGRTLSVNPALCQLLRVTREQLLANPDPFFYLDEDGRGVAQEFLAHAAEGGVTRTGFDCGLLQASDERSFGVRLGTVQGPRGEVFVTALVIDRSVERAEEAQAHRREQSRVLAEFAAGVAHNMNNLLTGILGAVSVLERPPHRPASEIAARMIGSVRQAAMQGASLTKELLQLARVRDGRATRGPVDVRQVVQQVVAVALALPGADRVRFDLQLADRAVMALCEDVGLQQVVLNLLTNSIDATPHEGVIQVRVGVQPSSGEARIDVQDFGCGMSEETRRQIFQPFFTTKKRAAQQPQLGGTGLGLSSALALVGAWGGRIDCNSVLGKGTTFSVVLPAALGAHAQLRARESSALRAPNA